jgi:hypothetical protein
MKLKRELAQKALSLFEKYPVLTITGPRQSGKTTFVQDVFPGLSYVNLEDMESRDFAREDPKGFLNSLGEGAIIDEIQNVPELTSSIQVLVDKKKKNSLYILTGSRQFEIMEALTQSLSGRSALLTLLPFSLNEIAALNQGKKLLADNRRLIYTGFYPRIYDQGLDPVQALGDYYVTYIERDIRKIINVKNLATFSNFMRLAAGRTGSILNISSLARDAGISHTNAREWLGLLQASYIVFLLEPWFSNINKRLVKSPKLYFYDVGLAAHLLHIENEKHVLSHPLKGNLFENLVVIEFLKRRFNNGLRNNLYFYKDSSGLEIDLFIQNGPNISAVEIKSGETMNGSFLDNLNLVQSNPPGNIKNSYLVYGGEGYENRHNVIVCGLQHLDRIFKQLNEQ